MNIPTEGLAHLLSADVGDRVQRQTVVEFIVI